MAILPDREGSNQHEHDGQQVGNYWTSRRIPHRQAGSPIGGHRLPFPAYAPLPERRRQRADGIQELGLPSGLQPVAVDQATRHDDAAGCWILGGMELPAHR